MASEVFDGLYWQVRGTRDPARNRPVTFSETPPDADGAGLVPIPVYDRNNQPMQLATDGDGRMPQFTADVQNGWLVCDGSEPVFVAAITSVARIAEFDGFRAALDAYREESAAAVTAAQTAQTEAERAADYVAGSGSTGGTTTTTAPVDTTSAITAYADSKAGATA